MCGGTLYPTCTVLNASLDQQDAFVHSLLACLSSSACSTFVCIFSDARAAAQSAYTGQFLGESHYQVYPGRPATGRSKRHEK
ncbi:hypothetical protein BCV70DRAFT_107356 [Testicularia cyperi]|uniref:Uncharacterized protein n=1 Tax=Testicularia cyperi TaxID=1882483 RepID=A0A317XPR5_9BASI|nr:hypothetical protein BCV70DRAFT_107356 [Testicularia cyperi]